MHIQEYLYVYIHTYTTTQVDPEYISANDINPLLEIQLKLAPPEIIFSPELGRNNANTGLRDIIMGWVMSFCNVGLLMRRIDTPAGDGDYLADIQVCMYVYLSLGLCFL